jgi:GWxTD domain-containing protein
MLSIPERKSIILFFALSFFMTFHSYGLDISVRSAQFKSEKQAYLEVYLYVVGSSVKYDTLEDNNLQAGVQITMMILQDSSIFTFDKFTMLSPTGFVPKDFMDLKRLPLKTGSYIFSVEAIDINDPNNKYNISYPLLVEDLTNTFQLSDIQLLSSVEKKNSDEAFNKNGFFLQPSAFHFFPAAMNQLHAYIEMYNDSHDFTSEHYIRYAIYQQINDQDQTLISQKYKKTEKVPFQAFFLQLPINELVSGNYIFSVEWLDKEKNLLHAKSVTFQRSNPYKDFVRLQPDKSIYGKAFVHALDKEEIEYILKALTPLVKGNQGVLLQQVMFEKNIDAQKYFLWNYFSELSPSEPHLAYQQFKEIAQAIDLTFKSHVGYGFETDRGRIYMKYGRPTEIIKSEEEPSAPPYEIWFYNEIQEVRQVNVKFIFHNPSLALNDMVLLHSNCKTERYNPRWEVELYKNAPGEQEGNSPYSTRMAENYRRDARKIWDEL